MRFIISAKAGTSRRCFGRDDRRVVAGLDGDALDEIADADLRVQRQEHGGPADAAPPVRQAFSETGNVSSRRIAPRFSSSKMMRSVISLERLAGHFLVGFLLEEGRVGVEVEEHRGARRGSKAWADVERPRLSNRAASERRSGSEVRAGDAM